MTAHMTYHSGDGRVTVNSHLCSFTPYRQESSTHRAVTFPATLGHHQHSPASSIVGPSAYTAPNNTHCCHSHFVCLFVRVYRTIGHSPLLFFSFLPSSFDLSLGLPSPWPISLVSYAACATFESRHDLTSSRTMVIENSRTHHAHEGFPPRVGDTGKLALGSNRKRSFGTHASPSGIPMHQLAAVLPLHAGRSILSFLLAMAPKHPTLVSFPYVVRHSMCTSLLYNILYCQRVVHMRRNTKLYQRNQGRGQALAQNSWDDIVPSLNAAAPFRRRTKEPSSNEKKIHNGQ